MSFLFTMKRKNFFFNKHTNTRSVIFLNSNAFYISRIIKMNEGNFINLFDLSGREYLAELIYVSLKYVKAYIIKKRENVKNASKFITLAQSLLKEKKMNYTIQKLTELGLSKWAPFKSSRSIPNFSNNKLHSKLKKWEKISIESSKQSHRIKIPDICYLPNLNKLLKLSKENDISIVFWEKSSLKINFLQNYIENNKFSLKSILLVVGPEGGFTPSEINLFINNRFIATNLNSRILRSETASVSSFTLLQHILKKNT